MQAVFPGKVKDFGTKKLTSAREDTLHYIGYLPKAGQQTRTVSLSGRYGRRFALCKLSSLRLVSATCSVPRDKRNGSSRPEVTAASIASIGRVPEACSDS